MSEEKDRNIGHEVGKGLKGLSDYAKELDKLNKELAGDPGGNSDGEPASGDNTQAEQ